MALNTTLLVISFFALFVCDPGKETRSFLLQNESSSDIEINLYQNGETSFAVLNEKTSFSILEFNSRGRDFGAITTYDSVHFMIDENHNIIWIKPENRFGYIDTENNVGETRLIYKDFYDRKNWTFLIAGDNEEWVYTIDPEDITQFSSN